MDLVPINLGTSVSYWIPIYLGIGFDTHLVGYCASIGIGGIVALIALCCVAERRPRKLSEHIIELPSGAKVRYYGR